MSKPNPKEEFHIVKRESLVLNILALIVTFLISTAFMAVGFTRSEDREFSFGLLVFGVIGAGVFVLFMRGGWMLTRGRNIHVLSITKHQFTWGMLGKEKELLISEIR